MSARKYGSKSLDMTFWKPCFLIFWASGSCFKGFLKNNGFGSSVRDRESFGFITVWRPRRRVVAGRGVDFGHFGLRDLVFKGFWKSCFCATESLRSVCFIRVLPPGPLLETMFLTFWPSGYCFKGFLKNNVSGSSVRDRESDGFITVWWVTS